MRAAGSDKAIYLVPPREMTLEFAIEFIESDELVEITPKYYSTWDHSTGITA